MFMEGWVYAVLAVLCWGVEAVLVGAVGEALDPVTGTGLSCAAAGALYALYLALSGRLEVSTVFSRGGLLYAAAGVVSFALGHLLYYTAIAKSGAGLSASLVATYPLVTVLVAAVVLGEPLTLRILVGALLIVAGGVVLLS